MLYDAKKWEPKPVVKTKFLTHKELGISPKGYEALVKVYQLLTDGTIPKRLFQMDTVGQPQISPEGDACGSPGCILGWCRAINPRFRHKKNGPLEALFFPNHVIGGYDASEKQAATALYGYLTTGDDGWKEAINR